MKQELVHRIAISQCEGGNLLEVGETLQQQVLTTVKAARNLEFVNGISQLQFFC